MSPAKLLGWYALGGLAVSLIVGPWPLVITGVALAVAYGYCGSRKLL